jgi:hypothetical protein
MKAAVERFSADVKRHYLDHSFYVLIRVRHGDAPPLDFNAALAANSLGQYAHTLVVDDCAGDCAEFGGAVHVGISD